MVGDVTAMRALSPIPVLGSTGDGTADKETHMICESSKSDEARIDAFDGDSNSDGNLTNLHNLLPVAENPGTTDPLPGLPLVECGSGNSSPGTVSVEQRTIHPHERAEVQGREEFTSSEVQKVTMHKYTATEKYNIHSTLVSCGNKC
ncbi:hypothetical protein QAD02_021678 [Eretmocerus hayati]|uniref:Uncharacterized protein n=1 Tax=Eretmocerus hayati TaxID=131215 RepID=A0ACC2PQK2_9HYME|nr:hypothetical protein QAD02_021678 [Eretmocerus hayati]